MKKLLKIKILIVGYGSIAKKHIACLSRQYNGYSLAVLRCSSTESAENYKTFFDLESAAKWKPDAVFITSPATLHISQSLVFAEIGSHLYIEKPLSVNMDSIDQLESLVEKHKLTVKIGYNLRHLNVVNKLKELIDENSIGKVYSLRAEVGQWLPDWRPASEYSNTVTAQKQLGGGAVLELSHEVDYLRFVFGEISSLSSSLSRQSDLEIDVEDNVEALLNFENGIRGSLHLDLLRRDKCRKCTVLGLEGSIETDLINGKLRIYSAVSSEWNEMVIEEQDTYSASHNDFFDSIAFQRESTIPLSEGKKSLAVCLAIKESSKLERKVTL